MNISLRTPITFLFSYRGSRIYIKREDMIPYSFGGNKVRIGLELLAELEKEGADYLISYGSPHSNLNRVMAHLARDNGLPCHILVSGPEKESRNLLYCREAGAEIEFVPKEQVKETLERILERAKKAGKRPFYVYGGTDGTGHEEIMQRAYRKAYGEIADFMEQTGTVFDCICLPLGTGMTMRGLILGRDEKKRESEYESCQMSGQNPAQKFPAYPQIYGISIARKQDYICPKERICMTSEYVGGEYGMLSPEIEDCILKIKEEQGICLDPVYTGKAFYGMLSEIKKGLIQGDILFIHTGGYPIYEEWMEKREGTCGAKST